MECFVAVLFVGLIAAVLFFWIRLRGMERNLSDRIVRLESVVDALLPAGRAIEHPLVRTTSTPGATPPQPRKAEPTPTSVGAPLPAASQTSLSTAPGRSAEPSPMPALAAAASPTEAQPVGEAPSIMESLADLVPDNALVRWFMGSHVVVRVGIVILFIGVAFLLRYAAEQGWLSIELRLTGAALLGMALTYAGWHVRKDRRIYGLTLQGGGIGIAYMTVFAAFRLYDLLPAGFSFGVLVGLGALCAGLAVLNDAKSLAVLAITGAFAAPILVSTGGGSHVTLFTYFALINAAVLGIAWFKAWRELNLVGYLFTFVLATLWGAQYYRPEYFASVEPFLVLFYLFYVAIGLLFTRRSDDSQVIPAGVIDAVLLFGTPVIAFAWQARLAAEFEVGLAWSALAIGVFHLLITAALFRFENERYAFLREGHLALGVIFVTLAVPFTFDNHITGAIWAIQGAGLVWAGLRQRRRFFVWMGSLVQLAAGGALLLHWIEVHIFPGLFTPGLGRAQLPVINAFLIGGALVALAGLSTGYLALVHARRRKSEREAAQGALDAVAPPDTSQAKRAEPRPEARLFAFATLATLWGLAWWYFTGLYEIVRFAPDAVAFFDGVMLFFVASGAIGEWVGGRAGWALLRATALLLWIPAAFFGLLHLALNQSPLLTGWGLPAWPSAIAVHYWMLYRRDENPALRYNHPVGLWLLTWLGLVEALGRVIVWSPQNAVWSQLAVAALPLALILVVTLAGNAIPWPTRKHYRLYMTAGLGPLLFLLGAWLLIVNLSSVGDSAPLPYLPVLNPLDITQAVILVAGGLWLAAQRRMGMDRSVFQAFRLGLMALIFLGINGMLARAAHHLFAVPFRFEALLRYAPLQVTYSILWVLLAMPLMVIGTRRKIRWVWFTGATLLGLTVVKLLFVDMSGADTLARIVSFIAVGLLMLIIGFVAPVPPLVRQEAETPADAAQPTQT